MRLTSSCDVGANLGSRIDRALVVLENERQEGARPNSRAFSSAPYPTASLYDSW